MKNKNFNIGDDVVKKSESFWLLLPFCIGSLMWLGIGVLGVFSFVGVCVFLITRFLAWAFNTDYFD